MTQLNVYLTFNGNCEDAMTFYQACLGGELTINKVGGSAIENQCPEAMKDQIMHSSLNKDYLVLMASDLLMERELIRGNATSLSLNCSSEDEIRTFFDKLSAGGKIIDPLKIQFWGALFGVLEDKFGIRWLLNFDQNQ